MKKIYRIVTIVWLLLYLAIEFLTDKGYIYVRYFYLGLALINIVYIVADKRQEK